MVAGVLLLLLGSIPTSSTATVAPILRAPGGLQEAPFTVIAERLYSEGGVYVAEGDVVVKRRDAIVYADRIQFDEERGVVVAEGNVTAVEGDAVLTCRRVEMKVPELVGGIEAAELRIKTEVPEALRDRLTPRALRIYGEDEMILKAEGLVRTGERTFQVEDGAFTVCECGEDAAPSWKIGAARAEVDLDSGAWLYWPVFFAKDVPVFALPVFYYPLGQRRSGLLTPRLSFSPVTGPSVAQPVYLTLGRSWDTTIEPGYLSSRGPAVSAELRWAPTQDSVGEARASLILDFGVLNGDQFDKALSSPIPRYALALDHVTSFDVDTKLAADLNVFGDPAYQEFADEFLERQVEASRSRITATHATPSSIRVAGGLQLLQDLRRDAYDVPSDQLREVSLLSGELPGPGEIRYRFAELRLDAPPHPILPDLPFAVQARATVDAFSAPRPEVPRFVRADFRPELLVPIHLFDLFTLEPSIAARGTVWGGRFESENVDATRIAVISRASLYTTLWRDYGSVVHRIRPELDYLLIPRIWSGGDDVFETDDEIDQLGTASQVRARVVTDLITPSGASLGSLEAWFGHDFRVFGEEEEGRGNSEVVLQGFGPLTPSDWPVTAAVNLRAAVDPDGPVLTDLFAALSIRAPYVSLGAAYQQLDDRMLLYPFVAPEELVPSHTINLAPYVPLDDFRALPAQDRIDFKPWSDFRGFSGSIQLNPYEPLTISFTINLTLDDEASLERAYGTGTTSVVRDTSTAVSWVSPCDCWSASLIMITARDRPGIPSFQFALDLARLGGL